MADVLDAYTAPIPLSVATCQPPASSADGQVPGTGVRDAAAKRAVIIAAACVRHAARDRSPRAQAQVGDAVLVSLGVTEPFSHVKDADGVFGSKSEGSETSGLS